MFLPKADRKIIPRLRSFWTTAILGQLNPAEVHKTNELQLPTVSNTEALEAWHHTPTLWHALDLVGSAFVIGDVTNDDVLSAAKYLEANATECPVPARSLVSRVLHPEEATGSNLENAQTSEEELRKELHSRRQRLIDEPRNAILWTDIGCLYTSLGQIEKAKHAIDMASILSPDNRFVVRSAARFLVHVGDHGKALRLLRNAAISGSDPWVVAAEIGISSFSKTNPRLLKLGRRMVVGRDFSESAKSELASAIATIEINEGNRKAARKLFKQSLILPTENSVAQAEWASARVGELNLRPAEVNIPLNYEAKSVHGYRISDWDMALSNAEKWLNDQPFSSRPASVASYLYNLLDRHEDAQRVLESSLALNPGDRGLINNMAFTLINLGRIESAEKMLNRIDPAATDDLATVTLTATQGLLLFRTGHLEIGRDRYLDAINLAKRQANSHYAALAAIYLAFEEIRAGSGTKLQTLKEAVQLATRSDEPDVRYLYARLATMAKVAKLVHD